MKIATYVIGTIISSLIIFFCGTVKAQKEVKVGKQIWMATNLNVEKFRNGEPILHAKTIGEWREAGLNKQPAWCYYEYDPKNGEKYGKLYNWFAVTDPRGIAPKGWHVASDKDWTTLITFLGGKENAAEKLKSISGWEELGNGNNSSGLSCLPGGLRNFYGEYKYEGIGGYWWTPMRILNLMRGNIISAI